MSSVPAPLLEKFFPQKRYVFSIRHPYDVVLSCFKQSFTPNAATENFRTLEDSCEFYDRVMSTWFNVFPTESERVLYVRYEELVTDFETQVTRVLAFLGLEWSDEVLRFSELSEQRGVATPGLRQGAERPFHRRAVFLAELPVRVRDRPRSQAQ